MRVLLQVVKKAEVSINGKIYSQIKEGFLLFVGFNHADNLDIVKKTLDKVLSLRVFKDQEDKMNLGLKEKSGEILCVSQFTLYADVKKGRRPSFNIAAPENISRPLYEQTIEYINSLGYRCQTGVFGADMEISLINDGPTTILIDSEDLC